ncbi:MAG: NnrS family protein [Gammaproteobacteria bacterium]|nr:MAG: NnrS family protein [Gammaproteobacteria bacterium]
MQQPTLNSQPLKQFALFELGFRPFFLLASLFSIIATTIWMATYTFGWSLPVSTITPIAWHGHEMVFGYSMAIIAGFLLTAVRNWTGVQTIKGLPLLLLALTWLLARTLPLLNSPLLFEWAAIFDIAFLLGLTLAVLHPIAKVKQWRQLLIVSILASILAANILYYLGVFHLVNQGISWGLFSAVYLIMALIFTLARRVMPFFIERGVGYQVQLKNWSFVDSSSLLFLAALWLADVFFKQALLTALFAIILAVLHTIRLKGWYTKGIWKKPLLWVLFLGYSMFVLGFILKGINFFSLYPTSLPLHAFTYGGIGMMTLGMISRISLGHTGRNINQPPTTVTWVFLGLFLGALVRVVMPILLPSFYIHWIGLSQILWIAAFVLFLYHYFMIFIRPRADGQSG